MKSIDLKGNARSATGKKATKELLRLTFLKESKQRTSAKRLV